VLESYSILQGKWRGSDSVQDHHCTAVNARKPCMLMTSVTN